MKYEKGKWYSFTIKSECECAAESVVRHIKRGDVPIDNILDFLRSQLKFNNPYWLPTKWYNSTTILYVSNDIDMVGDADVIRISDNDEDDGYFIPICYIEEATEV